MSGSNGNGMPDYIYLLENRLSADQRSALRHLRDAARQAEMILFLTGDAVRDLTSGHAVRDIEVAVHGNALELKKILGNTPVQIWGEDEASRSLYLCFPGTVRVDVVSTHRTEYPKPGQPVIHPASIHEDLRRRDFTANAMALSLNEGSFGLLMDPLNGAADIEARTLRLVSNYGFLEEPALMIRATRYRARLGWELDPKTQVRYENAKGEGVIESLSAHERSRELEQIAHEDDGLKVLHALENEGWMKVLFPPWTAARADEEKLAALHILAVDLLVQGVHADVSAAQMQLLTAKMPPKELAALKKQLLRPGFVEELNNLDGLASGFAKVLLAKDNQTPSASFKLFTSYDPEAVLWLGFTSKDAAVKDRFHQFLKVWPETRQRIPHALMQEMRIKPELANYNEIVQAVFLELIDGKLGTPEEMRAFLEPFSPPAPPPQITIKRTRGKRGEAKVKDYEDEEESEDGVEAEEDLDDMGGDDDEIGLGMGIPKVDLEPDPADEGESDDADEEAEEEEGDEEPEPVPGKRSSKGAKGTASEKPASVGKAEKNSPLPARKIESAPAVSGKLGKAHASSVHPIEPAGVAKGAAVKTPVPVAKPAAKTPATHGHGQSHAPAKSKAAPAKDAHKAKPAAKPEPKKSPAKPSKPAPKHAPAKSHASHHSPARHPSASKPHQPSKPAPGKSSAKKH
jgi:tRNA nucleotidyltransferase (CCA-adding enzyme)